MNGPQRVHIDRLELDLRGIPPATAEAAAQALGPALAQALAARRGSVVGGGRVDAGRLASPAAPGAPQLAAAIAARVAASLKGDAP